MLLIANVSVSDKSILIGEVRSVVRNRWLGQTMHNTRRVVAIPG